MRAITFLSIRIAISNIPRHSYFISYHPDGRQYTPHEWPLVRSVVEGSVISNEEIDVLFQDGSCGVLRLSSAPVRSNNSLDCVITGAVAIAVDITCERAQAEERLQVRCLV